MFLFQFPVLPGNSIVGVADSISDVDNDLDGGKQNYRPPTGWSTGTSRRLRNNNANSRSNKNFDILDEAASQEPDATYRPTPSSNFSQNNPKPNITPPSIELIPPAAPTTESSSVEDSSVEPSEDPVFKFIKRFDPTSPDVHQTAMSKSEILDLNGQLPAGQVSSEEDRTPRKNKNFGNSLNNFQTDNDKSFSEGTRFDSVNTKSSSPTEESASTGENGKRIPEPERVLLPPHAESASIPSTTVGPPIYYDWKWAVPAFDLVPPKESNKTNSTNLQTRSIQGKSPFSEVTRPEPKTTTPEPSNTEYNISSYFVPDYVFPLDKEHPGYDGDDAETSFQVKVARPGRQSFGENPNCPQCHPAYLKPGTCEPCIVKR